MLVCLVGAWPPRAGLPSATMTSSLPSPRSLDSVLKKYPTKFIGCCLANPADDGSGLKQFEHLVLKDGCRAVRFNPYLWPSGEKVYKRLKLTLELVKKEMEIRKIQESIAKAIEEKISGV